MVTVEGSFRKTGGAEGGFGIWDAATGGRLVVREGCYSLAWSQTNGMRVACEDNDGGTF
jgi:hypothetical protein